MTKQLDRFLMLETARPAGPASEHEHAIAPPTSARFAAVGVELSAEPVLEPVAAAPAPPRAEDFDPFAPPPIEALPTYELAPRNPDLARLTIRCVECGLENARSAHDVCGRCGTPLDSRAVRHLNEQLRQDELAEAFAAKQAAERAAAHAPVVDLMVAPDVDGERRWIDRLADRVALGPAATWTPLQRRALVVVIFGGVVGGLYALTGSALIGFVLALGVTLGLCMLPS